MNQSFTTFPIDDASDNSKQFGELFQHIDNLLSRSSSNAFIWEVSTTSANSVHVARRALIQNMLTASKFKFGKDASEEQALTTNVFKSSVKEDGTIVRTECNFATIDELSQQICFKSDIRFIFKVSKIWKQPDTVRAPLYGAKLKIMKIVFKERADKGLKRTYCF